MIRLFVGQRVRKRFAQVANFFILTFLLLMILVTIISSSPVTESSAAELAAPQFIQIRHQSCQPDRSPMSHILVIDDEPTICWSFREALKDDGHEVTIASSAEEALAIAGKCQPDAVLLDVRLPGRDGISIMSELQSRTNDAPIIVMTAFGSLDTAVKAVEAGAFDYLTKPFDLDDATAVVKRALQQSTVGKSAVKNIVEADGDRLIGSSPVMQAVFKQVALVAASHVPVLIAGENGTGKELVARAIHQHSPRKSGPFISVCLPGRSVSIIEAELFGMRTSGFNGGPAEERIGLIEQANGGMLLLDEVADFPASIQAKLLRAIEQQEIFAVGSMQPTPINVRFIAATNQSLAELISTGDFREDLYYRLSVVHIQLPPLRNRPEDVPQLAEFFLQKATGGAATKRFTPNALCDLSARYWAGNVRELRNCVEHAAIMTRGDTIDVSHLPNSAQASTMSVESANQLCDTTTAWVLDQLQPLDSGQSEAGLYEDFLRVVEPSLLKAVLDHCQNNRAAAARLLGLHRATLRQKLRSYGLNPGDE